MDEIKDTIDRIIKDIREKKGKIEIPDIPERCKSCFNGEFEVEGFSLNCEKYGENNCLIYREFINDNFGKDILPNLQEVEEQARKKIEMYLSNIQKFSINGKGLTIIGSLGTGKTSIIFLIVQEIFKRHISFHYSHSYKFFDRQDENILNKRFLFIDDLGVEVKSDWNKSYFDYLIDHRYRFKLPTIISSNLNEKKLKEEYPRAFDRLRKINYLIELKGGSKRW